MKVFDYDKFCAETFPRFLNQKSQRIGQYFYNEFRNQFGIIEIPEECNCFYENKLLTNFLNYIATFDGCVIITNANLEALDKS